MEFQVKHAKEAKLENAMQRKKEFFLYVATLLSCFLMILPSPAFAQRVRKTSEVSNAVPANVQLFPADYTDLIEKADLEKGKKSELYPQAIVMRIHPIAANKTPEVQVLSHWAKDLLNILAALTWYAEQEQFGLCRACLVQFEQEIVRLANLRRTWSPTPAELSQEEYVPSVIALEEIQFALERRAVLWKQALEAENGTSYPVSKHFSKNAEDLRQLTEKTLVVENYFSNEKTPGQSGGTIGEMWCEYLDTKSFIMDLEATQQSIYQPTRRVSVEISTIPVPMLVSFCDRANVILRRLDNRVLSKEQQAYLNNPVITAWKEELANWTADTVSTRIFLRDLEKFEENGGMSDMARVFRLSTRLSFSRTENYRRLGLIAHEMYGGPNVKVYVSKTLINYLLPPMEPEVASFREVIQKQQVVGRRKADMDIEMNFVPDNERLLLTLDLHGNISTSSRAKAFATILNNSGLAHVAAQKQIELTEKGFTLSPCEVNVKSNRLQLRNIRTDFDGIPILSGVFRGVVQNQYEARQGGAREETRRKIIRQVKDRVDEEANNRFGEFNERFRDFMTTSMNDFDLYLEKNKAATEEQWLLTSWAIRSQDSLSGNTPAPETLAGAFADMKIHESALNAVLGKLDIDGRTSTVGELKEMLAERFKRPELAEPGENDDIKIGFSEYNPLMIRFIDGQIEIGIAIDSLRISGKTYRDFKVRVRYRPVKTPEGKLVLQRDRLISLENVRAQFVIRAVFGKIFPVERPFSLSPKFLENDERFEGLMVGHCRIEKGWFTIALIADEESEAFKGLRGKALISTQAPKVRRR